MTSFDLKPQQKIFYSTETDKIVWSEERDEVPAFLQGRISLELWQKTFDLCLEQYRKLHRIKIWMTPFPVIILSQFYVHYIEFDFDQGWASIIAEIAKEYRAVGVQVTIAKEEFNYLRLRNKRQFYTGVGLHFEVAGGKVPTFAPQDHPVAFDEYGNKLEQTALSVDPVIPYYSEQVAPVTAVAS
jgi:hypothetical protein